MRTAISVLLVIVTQSSCAHQHLRHNTVRQSRTLAEIYEQQVLDNLAAFVANPHTLPSFAVPKDGTANVTTNGSLSSNPLDRFREVAGMSLERREFEQWGLTPITDPDKLTLMRCAYQRAVGCVDTTCIDCCDLEKRWHGKPDKRVKVLNTATGEYLGADGAFHFPGSGKPPTEMQAPDGLPIFTSDGEPTYNACGSRYIAEDGTIAVPQYNCNGPCAIKHGWFHVGCRLDAPLTGCTPVGHHYGTYVWVDDRFRHELTKLVLTILDFATGAPPRRPLKTVTLFVDANGNAVRESEAVGTVTADIAVTDPVSSVLVAEPVRKPGKGLFGMAIEAMSPDEPAADVLEPTGPPSDLRLEQFDPGAGFYHLQRRLDSFESR